VVGAGVPKETKAETFEKLYARLEGTVDKLEAGGLPLEQAIALYEEGMTLARQCQERLDEAELKITKLRESFAPLPERVNGRQLNEGTSDYEYAAEDELPNEEEDPFT
jgi:exodeoxyribonuclease VII small subunit